MDNQTATQVITVTVYFAAGLLILLVYVAYLKRWCRLRRDLQNSGGGDDAEPAMDVAVAAPETLAEAEAARRRRQILEAIRVVVVGSSAQGNGDEEEADCSICLCKYEAGEEARVLPECCHMYHKACIDPWLVVFNGQRCPLCCAPVVSPAEKPQ
ncbi:putative RING-H2 finger protein ATL69 [Zingiber officinale]|uniref:RING-type domain-containing protein n=1 Tax=Zingiber officinale TaxID=94328 RepID=A0A8J5F9M9_ZINOF|nr:putative RING-H2 finger protein ATL69 [Zingiber officinale]KAG6478954.1 hypothetical protein ZIOFF_062402 [Zingiber officinale]